MSFVHLHLHFFITTIYVFVKKSYYHFGEIGMRFDVRMNFKWESAFPATRGSLASCPNDYYFTFKLNKRGQEKHFSL